MKTSIFYLIAAVCTIGFSACCAPAEKDPKCRMAAEAGLCMAIIPRYYYNPQTSQCEQYTWGGCGDFAFETMQTCEETCE